LIVLWKEIEIFVVVVVVVVVVVDVVVVVVVLHCKNLLHALLVNI
jgi:hypothetical protein